MVANTGATARPSGIRPLDAPLPVQVEVGADGMPAAVGILRNKNAGRLARHGSTGSPRTESKISPPFILSLSKDGGQTFSCQWHRVLEVLDSWRIDDEWWRKTPIGRIYYRVVTEDDRSITIFRDLVSGAWYRQGS